MGNEFRPGLPVARLFALAEQDLLPAETVPLSLPDFILSQLCNVPPNTDVTHAMAHGALGGKLIGAGGGGFLMFYAGDKPKLRHAMREKGLQEVRFHFDFEGSKVVAQN